jgi:hypothetical protein
MYVAKTDELTPVEIIERTMNQLNMLRGSGSGQMSYIYCPYVCMLSQAHRYNPLQNEIQKCIFIT